MKDQCTGMNIKQKMIIKTRQTSIDIFESNFVEVNRLFVLAYSNQDDNAKRFKTLTYYLPKAIIKNYNVIFNGKNFYDQPIDCDVKWYEEITKLTTGQGEDYTAGWLLDHKYLKNIYRLIAVDLSR